jgi:hypothetical protein
MYLSFSGSIESGDVRKKYAEKNNLKKQNKSNEKIACKLSALFNWE